MHAAYTLRRALACLTFVCVCMCVCNLTLSGCCSERDAMDAKEKEAHTELKDLTKQLDKVRKLYLPCAFLSRLLLSVCLSVFHIYRPYLSRSIVIAPSETDEQGQPDEHVSTDT